MAFPSNPLVGDTFTIGGKIYRWNGTSWARTAQSVTGQLSSAAIADNSLPVSKLTSNALTPYALDADLTTANVIESGNLYFTNARTIAALTAGTGVIIESNGLIISTVVGGGGSGTLTSVFGQTLTVSNAQLACAVVSSGVLNTDNISEGANLYFTNLRSINALTAGSGIVIESNGLVISTATGGGSGTLTSVFGQTTSVSNAQLACAVISSGVLNTDNIAEGSNLYFTNARVYANILSLSYAQNTYVNTRLLTKANVADLNTNNVTEGSNLYFTNTRAIYSLSAGSGISIAANGRVTNSGVTSVAGQTGAISNAQLTAAISQGSISNLTVTGNISVSGNITANDVLTSTNIVVIGTLYAPNINGYSTNAYLTTRLLTKANVADLTTSNVAEGTNPYYSNSRVQEYLGNISGNLIPFVNEEYSLGSSTKRFKDLFLSGNTIALGETLLKSDPTVGGFTITSSNVEQTGSITFSVSANAALVSEIITTNVITVDSVTANTWNNLYSSNIIEGSNLFYSNARARAALSAGTGVTFNTNSGEISIGQNVSTTSSVEFKDLLVTGNVTFAGNATTINTQSLSITDNMLYLNEAMPEQIANVISDGANVTYYITGTHNAYVGYMIRVTGVNPAAFNIPYSSIIALTSNSFTVASSNTGSYVSGGNAFIKASVNPDLGFSGGYYDGTYHHAGLFRDATDGVWKFFDNYGPEPDEAVYIDTTHPTFRLANAAVRDITGNLIGNVTGIVSTLSNFTTSNLVEGANLYFTNTRVVSALTAGSNISIAANGLITAITQGGGTGAVSSVNGAIGAVSLFSSSNTEPTSNIVGSFWYKPNGGNLYVYVNDGQSNVWIELDTPFYAGGAGSGTVTNVFGQTQTISNAQLACAVISSGVLNSDNVTAGTTNLYFTNTRSVSALTGGSGVSIAANGLITSTFSTGVTSYNGLTGGITLAQIAQSVTNTGILTTANVIEQSNLYFTNTRAISSLTAGSGINIAANGLLTSSVSGGVVSVGGSTGAISNAQLACSIVTTGLLNTSNVTEGSNLYFTNTRAISSLTSGDGVSIAANGRITSTVVGGVSSVGGSTGAVSNAQLACSIISSGVLTTSNLNPFYTIIEKASTISGASGAYTHNLNNGAIFIHSSIAGNFTANFTNVSTTNDQAISVALVLVQGGTAYIANAVQIDNNAQTIKWINGQVPIGSPSNVNIQNFTLIRTGSAWTVLGSMSLYS